MKYKRLVLASLSISLAVTVSFVLWSIAYLSDLPSWVKTMSCILMIATGAMLCGCLCALAIATL